MNQEKGCLAKSICPLVGLAFLIFLPWLFYLNSTLWQSSVLRRYKALHELYHQLPSDDMSGGKSHLFAGKIFLFMQVAQVSKIIKVKRGRKKFFFKSTRRCPFSFDFDVFPAPWSTRSVHLLLLSSPRTQWLAVGHRIVLKTWKFKHGANWSQVVYVCTEWKGKNIGIQGELMHGILVLICRLGVSI